VDGQREFVSIDPMQRWNLTFTAGAVAASLALATPAVAAGVAVGGAIEAMNFRALHRSAKRLFAGELAGAGGWSSVFGVRFLLLAVGIGAAIAVGAHPVGLLIGLSLIVPATLLEAWRTRPPIIAGLPALAPDDPSWDRWDPWLARECGDDEESP
jgi:hypothetical protein